MVFPVILICIKWRKNHMLQQRRSEGFCGSQSVENMQFLAGRFRSSLFSMRCGKGFGRNFIV
uniref:Uncharacterized protein n=2 Tax=Brassica oleracea TaxID=3712 RepID=A0A0D3AQS0_BRAOL|nr:unnamed protein product [Brassica oleracea]